MSLLTLSVCISTTSTSTSDTTSSSCSTSCTTSCSTSCSSWSRVASRGDLQAVGIGAARLITTLTAEQGGNNLFCSAKYLFKKLIGTISRSAASSPPRYFCYFQLKICSCRSHLREVFASFRNHHHEWVTLSKFLVFFPSNILTLNYNIPILYSKVE